MTRENIGLGVAHCCANECTLSKHEVHWMNSSSVRCRIDHSNRLIQKKEKEADEASEAVVCGESLRALILVIDDDL